MRVGTAGHDVEPTVHERRRKRAGVLHDPLGIGLELRLQGLTERDRLGGDDVHQRPTLKPREDGGVDLLPEILVVGEDHAAARAPQGLVRRGGHHMGVGERARMRASGNEAREMRHVDHQERPDLVGDLAEPREVDGTRIRRSTGDDQRGLVFPRQRRDLVHVDERIVLAHPILDGVKPLAREVRRSAMRQVTARGQGHAHDGIARLTQREKHGLVCLCARMGLNIGEGASEQAFRPVDRKLLGHVNILAAAIVAAAGVPLGILVGEHRPHRLDHRPRDDVLGRD